MDSRRDTTAVAGTNLPSSSSSSTSSEEERDGEEEEEETLITQRDHHHNARNASFRFLSIISLPNSIRCFNFKYLLPILLPLLLLFLLTSAGLRSPFKFSTLPSPHHPSPTTTTTTTTHLLRSELRALRLLSDQHHSLLHLWNHQPNSSHLTSHKLLQSISLNTQIQNQLLPSPTLPILDTCPKTKMPRPKTNVTALKWKPRRRQRYLFAICVSGHFSDRLLCLRNHMLFAAALGRVLVVPSRKLDYRFERLIDLDRINDCVGSKALVSFEHFANTRKSRKNHLRVDRFLCYKSHPPCSLEDSHLKKLKSLGVSLPTLDVASLEKKKRITSEDIRSRFASKDEVLAVGDLSDANPDRYLVLSHRCAGAIIQPNRIVKQTAARFVQTFLGNRFVALHLRRRGFLTLCNAKEESCFFPLPQAAECILEVVKTTDSDVIYLSTDAAQTEITLLETLIASSNKKVIPLVKRPKHSYSGKWDSLLYRHHLNGDDQVVAMLDRVICAMSDVFIGSSGSAFTEDIIQFRKDWGFASTCDGYLCQGRKPNFVASME